MINNIIYYIVTLLFYFKLDLKLERVNSKFIETNHIQYKI
jgi:hypothetical protein